MKLEYLQNFTELKTEAFRVLMCHLGFASAACYRVVENGLVKLVSSAQQDDVLWPPAVTRLPLPSNYTIKEASETMLGWKKAVGSRAANSTLPKTAYLYFPEQQLEPIKIIFAIVSASGKRIRNGELSAPLEIIAARIRAILKETTDRQELSELGIAEHLRGLGSDLTAMIDHELRTPLAAIAGYTNLLREVDTHQQANKYHEYWQIIESQIKQASDTLDKLSLAMHLRGQTLALDTVEDFDADAELREICEQAKDRAVDFLSEEMCKRINIRFLRSTDRSCFLRGNKQLFGRAVWEVLKNAINHSRYGKIEVAAFASEEMLVIDIEDDGMGIAQGAEEIIFMRFFRDTSVLPQKRLKRGLGLGLFLARQIAERHNGTLVARRIKGHGAIFRFMWPMSEAAAPTLGRSTRRQGA